MPKYRNTKINGNGQPESAVGVKPSTRHTVDIHTHNVISAELKASTKDDDKPSDYENILLLIRKFDTLNTQIEQMNGNIAEIKDDIRSLKELHTEVDEIKDVSGDNAEKIENLEKELALAKKDITFLKATCISLHQNRVKEDQYTRRDNLLVDNIPENDNEDCTKVMTQSIVQQLKIDIDDAAKIRIVICHRLGPKKPDVCRTIICCFHYFADRESVWRKRSELKGTNIKLSEEFPKEVVVRRNAILYLLCSKHEN